MTEPRGAQRSFRVGPRQIAGGLVAIVIVWFALANSQRVRVDFLFGHRDVRLIFVILGSALLGAGAFALLRWRHARQRP